MSQEFLASITAAREQGVVIVVVAQPAEGNVNFGNYAAGNVLGEAGAISGRDLTTEAALTKLYYLISRNLSLADIEKKMQQPISEEVTPVGQYPVYEWRDIFGDSA